MAEAVGNQHSYIVTVNAGSSSVKLAVFSVPMMDRLTEVSIENIGQAAATLLSADGEQMVVADNHQAAAHILMDWLAERFSYDQVAAVGHRVVHGGPKYFKSLVATPEVLDNLRELIVFDPEHLPVELSLIELFEAALPSAKTVLCFDTAFHRHLPPYAQLLPLPRHLSAEGIRKYGFHGLSYACILDELRRVEGRAAANGKVIIAHLGSGASLAAIKEGESIDTTMSMTPASGIMMSSRSGDLDPGLVLYLAKNQGYDAERFGHLVNYESGLLGISETTADMKALLQAETEDNHAKDAVDIFCYQVKKTIGSFAAALNGLNTLVFTGGIGERAPKIRARVCAGLEFLGVQLDSDRNERGERLISADGSMVGVHVIHTDEATTIAAETLKIITSQPEG